MIKTQQIQSKSKIQGFTLIEVLVVLGLVVILVAWGIPNYRDLRSNRQVSDFANEMVYSFTQARNEAIRYGTTVSVIPDGSWQNGWRTEVNNMVEGSATPVEIAVQDSVANGVTLTQSAGAGAVIFNRFGGLQGGVERRFNLKSNPIISSADRDVVIKLSGTARVIR